MRYRAFDKQIDFHKARDDHRVRCLFAAKRSGKTEACVIESIYFIENQVGWDHSEVDDYTSLVVAPTNDMLRRICLPKFFAYAKSFDYKFNQSTQTLTWHNGSKVHFISGDRPERIEGLKINGFAWIDEVFQVSEHLFLEVLARTADTKSKIWVSGSLGQQYNNPKRHFIYKYFKERSFPDSLVMEWSTSDNPYFPKEELARLKNTLDPRTHRQMFTIDWNAVASSAVYEDFDNPNVIRDIKYNPNLETSISIDWGWAHDMACLFIQYDKQSDEVYVIDEIVEPKMTLDALWSKIKAKGYRIQHYFCDIAGNQEREQTGRSNVQWFRDPPRRIFFNYRATAITYGISIVRSYIKNGMGQRKLYISESKCPKLIDGMRNYSYPERDGQILNENPIKKDDDAVDALRYYFVNHLDKAIRRPEFGSFNRWDEQWGSI